MIYSLSSTSKKPHLKTLSRSLFKVEENSRTFQGPPSLPSVPHNSRTFQDCVNPSLKSLPLLNFVLGVVALASMQKDKNHI